MSFTIQNFLQLLQRAPFLPGGQVDNDWPFEQILKVFHVMGTPSEEIWPVCRAFQQGLVGKICFCGLPLREHTFVAAVGHMRRA